MSTKFCPECGIGISGAEARLGYCQNCKAHWEAGLREPQPPVDGHTCPECLKDVEPEELQMFGGLCEDCATFLE